MIGKVVFGCNPNLLRGRSERRKFLESKGLDLRHFPFDRESEEGGPTSNRGDVGPS